MKRLKKNKNFFLIIFIIVVILIVITTVSFTLSYGYFKKDVISANQIFKSGKFEITYSMGSNVTLDKTYPMSDRAGNASKANSITINNTGDYYACYALTLTDDKSNNLEKSQMRYSINRAARDYEDNDTLILGGVPSKDQVKLDFRTWIKDTETNETATNLKYSGNLQVEAISCPNSLGNKIFKDNEIITTKPTLTKSATDANEKGLYKVATENGNTYIFRGAVKNNYVRFAGKDWRIIRVNEDGTIRISGYGTECYGTYGNNNTSISKIHYKESLIKSKIDEWYNTNLKTNEDKIANTPFCDEFKVTEDSKHNYKNAATVYSSYTSTMNCKNPFTEKVGLITYDEANFAGFIFDSEDYFGKNTATRCIGCYLLNGFTMSISGSSNSDYESAKIWIIHSSSLFPNGIIYNEAAFPVISLNANVEVTGNGTESKPYEIK